MLEVQRAGWRRLDPADAPAEVGHLGTDAGIGKHTDAKRERYRADVIASLQRHAERDGCQVRIGELPVQACPRRLRRAGCGLRRESPARGPASPSPASPSPASPSPASPDPASGGPAGGTPQRRQQAQGLPVPEHPRGHVEPTSRLGDAHAANLTF